MKTKLDNGILYEYSDEAIHNIGLETEYGYLTKETAAAGNYKLFTEYWSADQPKYIAEYTSAGVTFPNASWYRW